MLIATEQVRTVPIRARPLYREPKKPQETQFSAHKTVKFCDRHDDDV